MAGKKITTKLKPKSKAMADLELSNPKISKTDAYLATHNTTNRATARAEAAKLTAKPSYQLYKQEHVQAAANTVVHLSQHAENENTRLSAANSLLDRELGKATLTTETKNTNLNVNVEASEETAQAFTEFMKKNTAAPN